MSGIINAAGTLLAALAVAGCTVRPITESNKAPDYTTRPHSLVLVPAIGGSLPDDQLKLFDTEFAAALRACGVKVAASPAFPSTDSFAITAAIRNAGDGANADSVLVLRPIATASNSSGQFAVGYLLSLDDLASKKPVWKATIHAQWDTLLSQNKVGRALAAAVVAQMRKDDLLPQQCAPAT